MRILHTVEFYEPSVGGAQEVVRQISTRLARRGHDVTVATTKLPDRRSRMIDGVCVQEFAISGNAVRGMRGDLDGYRDFVLHGGFDVVMGYAAQQWSVDALLPVLDQIPCARTFAPCGFSGLADPAYSAYFRALAGQLALYDALIFHSDAYQDIEFARAAGLTALTVVPNGADEREFGNLAALRDAGAAFRERHGVAPDAPLLLTVGGHTGEKGHALAIEALRRTAVAGAVLVIVGNTPLGRGCLWSCRLRAAAARRLSGKRVLLLDPPRDEVLAAYAAADLFLFASNTECSPLVLFEAMAAATPFVTLDVGNSAEIARWGGSGEVLPTRCLARGRVDGRAADMSGAVERLMADPQRRAAMAASGRERWASEFTWERLAARYERVYEDSLARRRLRDPVADR